MALRLYVLELTDRFKDWRFYGERGLAHQPVTVWVYEGTLKLE